MALFSSSFRSLPTQVTQLLRDEINRGTWCEWLPSERVLSETLQVSRKTIRKALAQLQRDRVVEVTHGLGNRVIMPARKNASGEGAAADLALLTPEPLEHLRPYTALWINHLKTYLMEQGMRLHLSSGRKYFTRNPGAALDRLVRSQPAGCWLLAQSTLPVQRWFKARGVPCLISGSSHPEANLPDVDLDHAAVNRHAVGAMLAAGHRRIAFLTERSARAGDLASETAFSEAVHSSPHPGAEALIAHHDADTVQVSQVLQRLLRQNHPPTAILASNSAVYLTTLCVLAQLGLRVPRDISLVSRGDDPFFTLMVPQPTRYACSPAVFARKLVKPLLQLLRGETVSPQHTRIMPTYSRGETLVSPAR